MKEGQICSRCGKRISYHNLKRHERNVHKIETTRKVPKKDTIFQCYHCGKNFTYKRSLLQHLRVFHHFKKPPKQEKSNPVIKAPKENKSAKREKSICSLCGKPIASSNLRRHERIMHKIETPRRRVPTECAIFQCYHCGRKFVHKKNLLSHIQVVHHFEKPPKAENNNPVTNHLDANVLVKLLKLPEWYIYSAREICTPQFTRTVVSFNVKRTSDVVKWINEYKLKSFVQLTKLGGNTKLVTDRIVYRVRYKCAHHKISKSKYSEAQKCPFKMFIRVICVKGHGEKYEFSEVSILTEEKKNYIPIHLAFIDLTDRKPSCMNAYVCQVTFRNLYHIHETNYRDSLKFSSPNPEVTQRFLQLFDEGNSPDRAIKRYTEELRAELKENFRWRKSDRTLLPSRAWVYRTYYCEYRKPNGPLRGTTMLEDARRKIAEYNSAAGCTCVKFVKRGDEFAVVAVTKFMRKILRLIRQTCEMTFVDSSGPVADFGLKVLLLMTDSCVGGLPIGAVITSSETTEMLSVIFDAFKSLCDEHSFDGQGAPAVFITEDCNDLRNALRSNFPHAHLLLCCYHVVQACWRYLLNPYNPVEKPNRRKYIAYVERMMYAKTENDYAKLFDRAATEKCERFVSYVKKLDERKEEWVLLYRKHLPVHGQHANNVCETAFRVLKEKILERLRAFCPEKLLDFILTDFENYYKDKLANIAKERSHPSLTLLQHKTDEAMFSIQNYGDDVFEVKNVKKNTAYTVYSNLRLCECTVGLDGRFCKHQSAVVRKYGFDFLYIVPQSEEGRLLLEKIADDNYDILCGFPSYILDVGMEEEVQYDVLTVPMDDTSSSEAESEDIVIAPSEVETPLRESTPPKPSAVGTPFVAALEETFALMKKDGECNDELRSSIINFCDKYKKLRTPDAKRSDL